MRISDWSSDVCSSDLRYAPSRRPISSPRACNPLNGRTITSNSTIFPFSSKRIMSIPFNRSEEHTSELQSLMRISYAVFCLKKKQTSTQILNIKQLHSQLPSTYYYVTNTSIHKN